MPLYAERRIGSTGKSLIYFNWICDCGNTGSSLARSMKIGETRSCGCLIKSVSSRRHQKCTSSEYKSWSSMKVRCLNTKHHAYHNYGGRGIKICDRWLNSFKHFYEDMGEKPAPKKDYSIDRINNDGDYEPSNCRWATKKEQAANQRPQTEWKTPDLQPRPPKKTGRMVACCHCGIEKYFKLGCITERNYCSRKCYHLTTKRKN